MKDGLLEDRWLYLSLFIPIFIVTLDIGWASLEQLQVIRETFIGQHSGSVEDITEIVEGSLLLADGKNPFTAGSDYAGGPIKYFIFAFLYLMFDPTYAEAVKIGSLFIAILYFVVIPALLTLYVARTNGRLAALLTLEAFFLFRRGLLRLGDTVLPKGLTLIGPSNYIGALWQQTIALPIAFFTLFLLTDIVENEKAISVRTSAATGLLIGVAGGMQYIVGFTTAVIVTITLVVNRKFYDWLIIGGLGALFIPIILIFPSTGSQAVSSVHLLWDFGLVFSPRVFLFLAYISAALWYTGERLSENYVFESAIVGSSIITLIYKGYVGWIATNISDAMLLAGAICATIHIVKLTRLRSLVERVETVPLKQNQGVISGLVVGSVIALGLFFAIPS